MKRKDWFLIVAILIFCIIIDQITKLWATQNPEIDLGTLKIILVHNHGAMLGLFSDLPAVLRIVTLATSGIFVLCIYAIIQFFIPGKMLALRVSLSVLVGGIFGNVLDRIFYGYVIDFISIKIKNWSSPIWNVADIIQWVGYIIMVYALLKYSHLLWPDQNERTKFWVNKKFQIKHSLFIMSSGVLLTLISVVFSYTYLKVTLQEVAGYNPQLIEKFTYPFLYTFGILTILFSIVLFLVGRSISHRIAGPVYAFERFLNEILDGKGLTKETQALKLRTNDDFKHLEDLAEQVKLKIAKMNAEKTINVTEYSDND